MPLKRHSKLVLITTATASFLLCTSTLRYESEANLVIFLHYGSAQKLAEPHFEYSICCPSKDFWWLLVCSRRSFPAYPPALALGHDLDGSSHPTCLCGDTIQQTLGRNAGLLQGASHQFNYKEHFQPDCLQMNYRRSASTKVRRDLAFKTF